MTKHKREKEVILYQQKLPVKNLRNNDCIILERESLYELKNAYFIIKINTGLAFIQRYRKEPTDKKY